MMIVIKWSHNKHAEHEATLAKSHLRHCKFCAAKKISRHFGGFKPVSPLKYGPDVTQ